MRCDTAGYYKRINESVITTPLYEDGLSMRRDLEQ